jgi:hypothetical protein
MTAVVRLQEQNSGVLSLIQREYPQYHPVLAMVQLAHRHDVHGQDPKLEFEIHKAIAPYVAPRLSSMEIRPPQEPTRVIVSLFDTQELPNGETVSVEVPLVREISEVVPLD